MLLHILFQLRNKDSRLLPHEWIQRANILDIERRCQRLSLSRMDRAFGKYESEADDSSEEIPHQPRFLEIIRVGTHYI